MEWDSGEVYFQNQLNAHLFFLLFGLSRSLKAELTYLTF